jgi:hypothetical protein
LANLNHNPQENHDHFDNNLDMAIKTYQLNFNLKPSTGILDGETISRMMMPRCGVPDTIDGKTRMHAAGSYNITLMERLSGHIRGDTLTRDFNLVPKQMKLVLLEIML